MARVKDGSPRYKCKCKPRRKHRTPLCPPNPTMEDATTNTVPVPLGPVKPFRFMDLPAELRNNVYRHLILHGRNVQFNYRANWEHRLTSTLPRRWYADIARAEQSYVKVLKKESKSLLLANKFISAEAKAVIYAQNTFSFVIDGLAHQKNSLHSSLIFGPLGEPERLPLLRNLRSVEIFVQLESRALEHWANKRQRGRLEHFVNIMKEHADDENKKSLLQNLRVVIMTPVLPYNNYRGLSSNVFPGEPVSLEKHMFACESLAALRGVKEVRIEGLPEWFTQCLQLAMEGKNGEPLDIDYPDVWIKRRVPNTKRKKAYLVSTKAWWQPKFNWTEFAERNGIQLPSGLDIMKLGMPPEESKDEEKWR